MDDFEGAVNDQEKFDELILDAFKRTDVDESGFIDRAELKKMLESFVRECELDLEVDDEFVEKHFKAIDANEDDKLSEEEFKKFYSEVLQRVYQVSKRFLYDKRIELEQELEEAEEEENTHVITWRKEEEDLDIDTRKELAEELKVVIQDPEGISAAAHEIEVEQEE